MSRTHQVEKARHEYRQFIRELSAFRARNVAIGDTDPPIEPFKAVARIEVLNVFLEKHPEYRELREELLEVRKQEATFDLLVDRWREISGQC